MTDIQPILSRLGLAQYVDRFSEEGFDIWETVLEITESDLYDRTVYLQEVRLIVPLQECVGGKAWTPPGQKPSNLTLISAGVFRQHQANVDLGVAKRDSPDARRERGATEFALQIRQSR